MPSIESIINRQFRQWELQKSQRQEKPAAPALPPPIISVSRETGTRGAYFARLIAEKLDFQLIHREVIDAICASSGYRKRIIESLDEKYRGDIEMLVESFLTGQAVDSSDYIRHLYTVVQSMARLGGVVLVGRGGNFILGPDHGFHIRFVGPHEMRIKNLITYKQMSHDEAAAEVDRSDADRREMIEKLFDADINDPHHYDLMVNIAFIDIEDIVPLVIDTLNDKFKRLGYEEIEMA